MAEKIPVADKTNHKRLSFVKFLQQIDALSESVVIEQELENVSSDDLRACLEEKRIISTGYFDNLKKVYENLDYVDLKTIAIEPWMAGKIPEKVAREYELVLLENTHAGIKVGMRNPLDDEALELVSGLLNAYAIPVLVDARDLRRTINLMYRKSKEIDRLAQVLSKGVDSYLSGKGRTSVSDEQDILDDNPALLLLQTILYEAHQLEASDIHLESSRNAFRIRIRIDGKLHEQLIPEPRIANNLFRVIKVISGLDITQQLMPQDGSFEINIGDEILNVRVSIIPIEEGHSLVMRILEHSEKLQALDELINDEDVTKRIREYLRGRQGMLLVTGPTGSGKSTSLYSALKELNNKDTKIITLEDPIEITIPGVNQLQVLPDAGLDFADGLRAALRQDPDIIMLGEIRDKNTANIAIRSAITGHKVLATLHTKNVTNTISRLLNLEVDGFLLGAALRLLIAQRLVRKICTHCSEPYTLKEQDKTALAQVIDPERLAGASGFARGAGCSQCQNTGYQGRVAVFEILQLNEKMIEALDRNELAEFTKLTNEELKGKHLVDYAFNLAKKSMTTLDEVISLAND